MLSTEVCRFKLLIKYLAESGRTFFGWLSVLLSVDRCDLCIGRDLVLGVGGQKLLNFGVDSRWKKCVFKRMYFTLVPIKCFRCLKK